MSLGIAIFNFIIYASKLIDKNFEFGVMFLLADIMIIIFIVKILLISSRLATMKSGKQSFLIFYYLIFKD